MQKECQCKIGTIFLTGRCLCDCNNIKVFKPRCLSNGQWSDTVGCHENSIGVGGILQSFDMTVQFNNDEFLLLKIPPLNITVFRYI